MISTNNLGKTFKERPAVQGITMDLPAGSATALIGANGAGKSTTIRMLMGLLTPTSGRASVLGVDSRKIGHRELGQIGYIAESQAMPSRLTTGEYIAYLRPFYPTWDSVLEAEIVAQMHLPLNVRIKDLSHGMRMKMAAVCALAFCPKVLILDEPLSGLDPLVRDDLMETLVKQAGETTILISSQELGDIEGLATHIVMLEEGRLLFQESMDTLASRFREVRVTCASEARRPATVPQDWLQVEAVGNVLTFVETSFSEPELAEQIRANVGEVRRIDARPMPLRSIFTTLARARRDKEGVR